MSVQFLGLQISIIRPLILAQAFQPFQLVALRCHKIRTQGYRYGLISPRKDKTHQTIDIVFNKEYRSK